MDDVLVVPPFTDFTTEVVPPAGMALLDLNEHLVRRLAEPARLRAAAARPAAGPLTALFGRAAAAILEREAYDDAHLRAVGTALGLAADPAVRLAVDGLELTEGSPESSRDLLGAARRCELFAPEVELAREVAAGRRAHVVVDRADQLPAAFALVEALRAGSPGKRGAGEGVTLCGRLVIEHRGALRRVPELAGVRWGSWSPERVIASCWHATGSARATGSGHAASGPASGSASGAASGVVRWVDGGRPVPGGGVPWAGRVDAARAAALAPEALGRCRGLTLLVARADFLGTALGMTGASVDLRRLPAALPPGVPVTCELAVGAPGVTAEAVDESVELLAGGAEGIRLGGLRPYRMGARAPWAAGEVARLPPDPGHDLRRWAEFDAPGTLRPAEVATLLRRWTARLPGLLPGRLAACAVTGPAVPGPAWDPCTEIVTGVGPDGRGPGTFAVNLRSGRFIRLAAGPHVPGHLAGPVRRRP
ncbi:hypothetical protein [Nonomuraea sp. NPDC050783]|uniref:hypothetical protein n=1 Tax=Nonomuraea sp. NPDC050783 TaxID=3154634 RepID=UPI00346554FD